MSRELWNNFLRSCLLLLVSLFVFGGCISTTTPQGEEELPAVSTTVEGSTDIELPSEMKWNSKESMVIKTDSFRGGTLVYSGRVEINSLKDFIISSMKRNKWKHVGEASYTNILLAFTKPNKTCMVTLNEGIGGPLGSTHATLYVTVDVAAAKRLNPFGEAIK